jgi:LuxR family transcriptional regulator, maltose regulon positive regulatory protein
MHRMGCLNAIIPAMLGTSVLLQTPADGKSTGRGRPSVNLGRQRACGVQRTHGLPFELVVSKLRRPSVRPGTVRRSPLIEVLARGDLRPVVSVVASAGYGKTTLLAQWAERDGQAFAWVSLDEQDNDPKVLLSYVAAALDAVEPVGELVFDALASPGSSVPGPVVSALGFAFSSMTVPVVLVLDDVHVLDDHECWAALSVLADHVPPGSRLVLSGRDAPLLALARLRTADRMLELGPRDLALTHEEASSLLRNASLSVGEGDVAELYRRTEGWSAGLYLAALGLREGGPVASVADSFGGGDRLVSEYIQSEVLARLSSRQRVFLARTAVLERMCGPLCQAVLDQPEAAATLAGLARSNLLLVPLDAQGEWYRYHHLFRDMLLAELRRSEPGLIPVLQRRAARWCARNDLAEEAVEYAIAVGDVGMAAALVGKLAVRAYRQGRVAAVQRWLRWLEDQGGIEGHPMVAVLAGILSTATGRAAEAERWADVVDHWQYGEASGPDNPAAEAWAALLRAVLCQHGIKQMRADADEAARLFAAESVWEPAAALMQGVAQVLSGDLDGGDASLEDAASIRKVTAAPGVVEVALCERSLVAMARGDWNRAEVLAARARAVVCRAGGQEYYATPLVCAVHACTAQRRGDVSAARQELVTAQRLRPLLTYALPHFAVQARIELARVHLALSDPAGAWTLMREVDELLRCRPDLGNLTSEAAAFRARLSEEHGPSVPGVSALTTAELRLLPMLATHLSFPQIGAKLFLSRHTVKSEATSMYRKLGVSSRANAVVRSRELGLLPGDDRSFIPSRG